MVLGFLYFGELDDFGVPEASRDTSNVCCGQLVRYEMFEISPVLDQRAFFGVFHNGFFMQSYFKYGSYGVVSKSSGIMIIGYFRFRG